MDINTKIQLIPLENILININKEQQYLSILIQMSVNAHIDANELVSRFRTNERTDSVR